jgi:hypothetical protein
MITLSVLSLVLIGYALEHHLDPRLRYRQGTELDAY